MTTKAHVVVRTVSGATYYGRTRTFGPDNEDFNAIQLGLSNIYNRSGGYTLHCDYGRQVHFHVRNIESIELEVEKPY